MVKFQNIVLVAFISAGSLFAADKNTIEIDLTTARIEIADKKHPTHRLAAQELEKHLALIAGERRPSKKGFAFVIGRKAPSAADAPEWTSKAAVSTDAVYFWGDDGVERDGKGRIKPRHGSLFAMYGFLEKVLGVKWVCSGDDGIVFKAEVVVSKKAPEADGGYVCPIVKLNETTDTEDDTPAMTIYMKRNVNVETERFSLARKTAISVDEIYTVALSNASKVVLATFKK